MAARALRQYTPHRRGQGGWHTQLSGGGLSSDAVLYGSLSFVSAMPVPVESENWTLLDEWWVTFIDNCSFSTVSEQHPSLDDRRWVGEWSTLDEWWRSHTETQHDRLTELRNQLHQLDDEWAKSRSRFDDDPLAVDWASRRWMAGPLRPNQEENWSQWLAHTLRSGPAAFSGNLFSSNFEQRPERVDREVHLVDHAGMDRYADILAFYGDRAISIEVKKGDEHYKKTTHTANLIESQLDYSWDHYLLLPRRKQGALEMAFQEQLVEEAEQPLTILSDSSNDIDIRFWEDVSAVLRDVLLANIDANSHWESSAYLLCTLIEQKIARYLPRPLVDRLVDATDVINSAAPIAITDNRIEEQMAYFRTVSGMYAHE